MKKIIRFTFAALMLVALAGCKGDDPIVTPGPDGPDGPDGPGPEKPSLSENIQFTIEVTDVTDVTAKVRVSHDGTTSDRWYGFATYEDVDLAIDKKLAEITEQGIQNVLEDEDELTFDLNLLYPDTKYTFVALALTPEGKVYGKTGIAEFTTEEGFLKRLEGWDIKYTGRQEVDGYVQDYTITVSAGDSRTYLCSGFLKSYVEEDGVEAVIKQYLEDLKVTFNEYNAAMGGIFQFDQLLTRGDVVQSLVFWPEEWISIAYEVKNQEITGYYIMTEPFTIEEEIATEAYSSWFGDWTFTGANGVAWDMTIEQEYINESYLLKGWEGQDIGIPMEWADAIEMWTIVSGSFGTIQFEGGIEGELFLYPASVDENGKGIVYNTKGVTIGYGEDINGERRFYTEPLQTEDGGTVTLTHMVFAAVIDGQMYGISPTEEWPTFPMTITPRESSANASAAKMSFSKAMAPAALYPIENVKTL